MKGLKRLLCLVLAVAMLMAVCATGAFGAAPDFRDYSAVENKAAVTTLVDLGIINGIQQADGSYKFDPDAEITREQMAKMIAVAVTLATGEKITGTKGRFNDVDDRWSKDYVNFCADKGIINGLGDGSFGYDGSVTVAQTAKLLLAAMGTTGLTGDAWLENTINAANRIKLMDGITTGPNDPISRDEAALMIYTALMLSDGSASLPEVNYIPGGETVEYDSLTIGENTCFATASGYTLTMIVDGVHKDIAPGKYDGKVFICSTENVTAIYESHGSKNEQTMAVALYVDETGVVAEKSVLKALNNVAYNSEGATGGSVTSEGQRFGAVRVGGDGEYTVSNMEVSLTGIGGNDFTGIGSAFAAADNGKLTLNNVTVNTNGILRTAAFVGNNGTLTVNNSYFYCNDGGYTSATAPTVSGAGMTSPPKALGVLGYCRATCMVDSGTSYYNNSTIISEMWGALATDDVDSGKMYVDGCTIETKTNGYGAYSIGPCEEYFKNSVFNVADMGIICAAEGHCELDNTVINSERYGIVTHQPFGLISRIYLKNGSVINAEYCGIQIKSRGSDVRIEDSEINVENGPMIQAQYNDDTGAGTIYDAFEVTVDIKSSDLTGDIVQSQPGGTKGDAVMEISMDSSTITGAVTTAIQTNQVTDGKFDENNNYLVGRCTNAFAALEGSQLRLTMVNSSVWTVTEASYLTYLNVGTDCKVNGKIYVDYQLVEGPGEYEGNIIVMPASEEEAPAAPEATDYEWADYQQFLCQIARELAPEEGDSLEHEEAIMQCETMEQLYEVSTMGFMFQVLKVPSFTEWVEMGAISGADWVAANA